MTTTNCITNFIDDWNTTPLLSEKRKESLKVSLALRVAGVALGILTLCATACALASIPIAPIGAALGLIGCAFLFDISWELLHIGNNQSNRIHTRVEPTSSTTTKVTGVMASIVEKGTALIQKVNGKSDEQAEAAGQIAGECVKDQALGPDRSELFRRSDFNGALLAGVIVNWMEKQDRDVKAYFAQ